MCTGAKLYVHKFKFYNTVYGLLLLDVHFLSMGTLATNTSVLQQGDVLNAVVYRAMQGAAHLVVFDSVLAFSYTNKVTQPAANVTYTLYWVSLAVNVPPRSQAKVILHGSVDQLTLVKSFRQLPGMYTMFRAGLVRVAEGSKLFVTSAHPAVPSSAVQKSVSISDNVSIIC
jgi:hypothetical protein